MGVIEGYANIVSNTEFTEEQKNYHLKFFTLVIAIKLLLILVGILLITYFLNISAPKSLDDS